MADDSSSQHAAARAMTRRMIEKLRDELLDRGYEEEADSLEKAARKKLSPTDSTTDARPPVVAPFARITKPA